MYYMGKHTICVFGKTSSTLPEGIDQFNFSKQSIIFFFLFEL